MKRKNNFLLTLILILILIACDKSNTEIANEIEVSQTNTQITQIQQKEMELSIETQVPIVANNEIKIPQTNAQVTEIQQKEMDILSEWMCVDTSNIPWVDDLNTANKDDLKCKMDIEYTDSSIIVKSNGIPNHDFQSGIGCCASEQNYTWTLPRYPRIAKEVTMAPDRGPIAITVTGVPIYGPEEGPGGDAVALHHDYFVEDRQPIELGLCGGHSGPDGTYHYHFDANCTHWHPDEESGEKWIDWVIDKIDKTIHSPILGYAFDGFPIYGMYGWNENGLVTMMTSSYRLKSGANGYGGIDDWEYISGLGTLDECNGRSSSSPEYPDGIYHYHSTLFNGGNLIGFPYFLLCYKGTPDESNFSEGQGDGQLDRPLMGQGNGQMPPPRRKQ